MPQRRSESTTSCCPRSPILRKAQAEGAPQIHDDCAAATRFTNGIWEMQKAGRSRDQAAKHVTRLDFINNRLVPNAIEPRAAIGEYDAGTDSLTLWNTTQNPHVARLVISAFVGMRPSTSCA